MYLNAAIVAGIQGENTKAEQFIDRYFNQLPIDFTEIAGNRHHACQVLAMIAAAQSAVECLTKAFEQPSMTSAFFEPHMPFYDPIRDSDAFKQLLIKFNVDS